MKNTFDKDLKQRLDEASLPEAGLRFDKDKLWGKIEKKKAKKRISFLPWISHAAAVAAGLAAGIFLFVHKDQPASDHSVIVQQKETPVLRTITDTVYIVKHEKEQTQPSVLRKTTKAQQPVAVATVQQPVKIITDPKLPEKEAQPVIALHKPNPPKVMHLIDMDNENAQPYTRERKRNTFFVNLSDRSQSGSGTESFSMLVAQKLNLTKN